MLRLPRLLTGLLLLLTLLTLWVAVGLGSNEGRLLFDAGWPARLADSNAGPEGQILLHWRIPRVAAAVIVGAALALAGLLLQGITRNPLADPYLIGVSGGAGLCVVLLQSLPWEVGQLAWWAIPLAAFTGAMLAMAAVLTLARGGGAGRLSVVSLILAGFVINAFCAALMAFLLARFDPFRLRITSSWLTGGIGFFRWQELAVVAAVVVAIAIMLRRSAHRLNALALGAEGAELVGVDAVQLMRRSAVLASVLAAAGVSLAGLLGYVGLLVPHAIRLMLGSDFRVTLPASAVAGALLVLVADTGARALFVPEELPVGVLTALVGCPVLLLLLRGQLRARRG